MEHWKTGAIKKHPGASIEPALHQDARPAGGSGIFSNCLQHLSKARRGLAPGG